MIKQTPWLERTFNFEFPAGLFPVILERYTGTPARVEEMVRNLPEDMIMKKPNGRYSIKEHIGHLTDLEALHEKRFEEFLEDKKVLSAADMANKKTDEAHHNNKAIETLLADFRKTRMTFVKRLRETDDAFIVRTALHPRLKTPMRLVDSIFFACEHDDHHLTKMREIMNGEGKS